MYAPLVETKICLYISQDLGQAPLITLWSMSITLGENVCLLVICGLYLWREKEKTGSDQGERDRLTVVGLHKPLHRGEQMGLLTPIRNSWSCLSRFPWPQSPQGFHAVTLSSLSSWGVIFCPFNKAAPVPIFQLFGLLEGSSGARDFGCSFLVFGSLQILSV